MDGMPIDDSEADPMRSMWGRQSPPWTIPGKVPGKQLQDNNSPLRRLPIIVSTRMGPVGYQSQNIVCYTGPYLACGSGRTFDGPDSIILLDHARLVNRTRLAAHRAQLQACYLALPSRDVEEVEVVEDREEEEFCLDRLAIAGAGIE
jgi:hypothetical protein